MDLLRARIHAELERRLTAKAEESLEEFIRVFWPVVDPAPFKHGRHLGLVCERLEAVTTGELGANLMINVPPGHQKSLTVSVFWPAWTWATLPSRRFMFTSYSGDLALRDADRTRELLRSSEYQARFADRFHLRRGQDVKSRYQNDQRGYRFSTAVRGIMGEGGDYVVLDDPHNVETAESDDVRNETVRKIRLALPTRVRSDEGAVVCMMQRLHKLDFAGVVLAEEPEKWHHLCLPARFEPDHPHVTRETRLPSGRILSGDWRQRDGELLFPELFPEDRLTKLEETLGPYGAAGQLQQRPAPRQGGLFRRDCWRIVPELPKERAELVVRAWDLAGTSLEESKSAKWTAGVRMWKIGGAYYVDHVERFRGTPAEVERRMKARAAKDGKAIVIDLPQDPGQAGKFQVRYLVGRLAGYSVFHSPELGSKTQRADPYAAQQEVGNVYLVGTETTPWIRAFIEEHALFPSGDYSDQVDAAARAFARCTTGVTRVGRTTGAN